MKGSIYTIKRGFTLAEVLITLGIVGVVAALTAPALVLSSKNKTNAAKLSVAVSNLENAFTNMMVKENVDLLSLTQAWTEEMNKRAVFAGHLGQHIHLNGFKGNDFNENAGVDKYYGNNPKPCFMSAAEGYKMNY